MVQQILYALCLQNMFTAQTVDRSRVNQIMINLVSRYEDENDLVHYDSSPRYTLCGRSVHSYASYPDRPIQTTLFLRHTTCPRCLLLVEP